MHSNLFLLFGFGEQLRIGLAILGALLFVFTVISVLRTLVVPGGNITNMARFSDQFVILLYRLALVSKKSFESRNVALSSQPAAVLFVTLSAWALSFLLASSLLLMPVVSNFGDAIREAGASLLTLGFTSTNQPWATAVDFTAGFTGLIVVALQIAYLPTLYNAYNRRESEVTLLAARAGQPAWGPEVLRRSRIGIVSAELPILYLAWEKWAAEVAESHVSYPNLIRFRSPGIATSWIISLLAVLDAAAMHLALAPSDAPMQARLCIQMGFTALRQIGRSRKVPFNEDPLPTDPIAISKEEFARAVDMLKAVGFPIERNIDDAYKHFAGWRVNYESLAFRLCYQIDAVPAPWSGPRRWKTIDIDFPTITNRTPENPNAEQILPEHNGNF